MNVLTSGMNTGAVFLVEERGQGVLVLKIDTGTQATAAVGGQVERCGRRVPPRQEHPQRVLDDLAQGAAFAQGVVARLAKQIIIDGDRGAHGAS